MHDVTFEEMTRIDGGDICFPFGFPPPFYVGPGDGCWGIRWVM